jgi:hypothetical protein
MFAIIIWFHLKPIKSGSGKSKRPLLFSIVIFDDFGDKKIKREKHRNKGKTEF